MYLYQNNYKIITVKTWHFSYIDRTILSLFLEVTEVKDKEDKRENNCGRLKELID